MNDWENFPKKIFGENVELIELDKKHFQALEAAARDKSIWQFFPYDGSTPENFLKIFDSMLAEKDKRTQHPFVIYHKSDKKIIGSTRFLDIQPLHKKLEIGGTWLVPDYWASIVNIECKLLLLTYCFEQLGTVRVQLKTDENNARSRKAIEKIGGKFEGILRNDMIRENGTKRNSAYYSIIEEEWLDKKIRLTNLYLEKNHAHK